MPNRLIHETSPYLRQHAENPVDWYPWGDEAFAEAKRRNVPVLLSIGYSACHWCHVMERESFANPVVAARINSLFVPVKVDREERPDVDEVYMRAVQAFNRGQGGWPMTVFLTPDREPFFGGTYFPPVARGSLPSFTEVLGHVGDVWRKQPGEVTRITEQVARLYEESARARPSPRLLARDWLQQVAAGVAEDFDPANGGFGDSPKFPPHGTLAVLLAHHRRTGDPHSLHMVTTTLDGMAKGGMYDLAGGGFARYSVDAEWRVPHFEKMLYDTAQLVPVYLDAWKVTKDVQYARIVRESVGFLLREFALDGGGFAASLDADSMVAGSFTEGGYYTFTQDEVREALGSDATRACVLLDVSPVGTAEDGRSVLRTLEPIERMPAAERQFLDAVLPKLRAAREQRQRPHRDDKRILSWNALAISALAQASALDPAWLAPAVEAARFLLGHLRVDGGWRRTWLDGSASRQTAFADDHANLLLAFLDLYEATFDAAWLAEAGAVADAVVARFWDDATGTLFTTAHGEPALLSRGRPTIGGAEPSAIGAAALGFVRLSKLAGRADLEERASSLLRSVQFALSRGVRALGQEALAGAWLADGGAEVAIVGAPDGDDTRALIAEVRQRYLPFTVVAQIGPDGQPALPWVEGKTPIGGRATAYVCEGFSCLMPTPSPSVLAAQLEDRMQQPAASSETRVAAPDLPSAPDVWLNTQSPPTLERLRGHVVVLDFWTYCCVNCMHVLPELAAIEQRYVGQPVTVLGIHCAKFPAEQTAEGVRAAIERYGVRHPVLNDPDHAVWDEYAVRSWPTLVVLDTSGRIAHQRGGEVDRADLAALIDQLLEEGRAAGTLAAGPLPSPAVPAPTRAAREGQVALRFPGKVHVWPDAFDQESGVDVFGPDRSARVYVTDTGHHRILECTIALDDEAWPYLVVERTFGSGAAGFVDGSAATAAFRAPQGARRFGSTLYVADTENHALRSVDLVDGTVRTLAGNGARGTTSPTVDEMAQPGSIPLRSPWDVEVMAMRNHHLVFVAMAGSHQIWVYGGGHVGLHTGSGREDHIDGPASQAALAQPSGLAQLGRYLLFVDAETSSIRAVDLQSHQVLTVMGRGLFDFGDRDGASDVARMQHPLGLTYAEDLIYVADTLNHKVKSVALNDGHTKTVVGGTRDVLNEPGGIARAGGTLLVADTNNHRLRAVDPHNGEIRDLPVYLRDPRGA